MASEVLEGLQVRAGMRIVDGTFGGGGHTRLLAAAVGAEGHVISLDRDPAPIERAEQTAGGLPVTAVCSSYDELPEVLKQLEIDSVDGILLDLGLSSDQLADRSRGFSYSVDGPLDMRFDPRSGPAAWELLMRLREDEIASIIYRYGDERFSRRVARRIVLRRKERRAVKTAADLADLVRRCVPRSRGHSIDPATRTFQALRIAVNRELEILERAMKRLPDCLAPGGRLAVISFHSLEDRIVKHGLREDERMEVITRRPLRPSDAETAVNPRASSARLRIAQRRA